MNPLSIIVVGASGDLARKKIFPALFSLYSQGLLPDDFNVFGFSRTQFTDTDFRAKIAEKLTCRYTPEHSCAGKMEEFLSHCFYSAGSYDSSDSFLDLYQVMRKSESSDTCNRMFYLAIPPSLFDDVARSIAGAGLVTCGNDGPWSRVVIEKPFGSDRQSSDALIKDMEQVFTERQIYRIDHYLGKEVVQNLMVLRFANLVFEPIWNRDHIEKICIDWKEDIGIDDRASYFDQYGIIRDVVQNHLLQILSLVAMERPISTDANHVRDEKVKVLKCIKPLTMDHIEVGQYVSGDHNDNTHPGYLEENGVPADSITPTFAASAINIHNARWEGVPFIVTAGKGLDDRVSEVRIHFKDIPANIFCKDESCLPSNQLLIRIQPDEAIHLKIINKEPGLNKGPIECDLDLKYQSEFESEIPDAYECLLLDVIEEDKSLFIRSDELGAAWDIFTPVLHELEEKAVKPKPYPFGSKRPFASKDIL
jgi:glucose-6-phosphate 1-dehydrogenase